PRSSAWGIGVALLAILIAGLNFYLAVIRPLMYLWRRGSSDGYRNISVIPVVGSVLLVAGLIVGFGDWRVALSGVITGALDVGGLPWFLLMTWRDQSFWDGYNMWSTRSEKLEGGQVLKIAIERESVPVPFSEVVWRWQSDADFRAFFIGLLAEAPFA